MTEGSFLGSARAVARARSMAEIKSVVSAVSGTVIGSTPVPFEILMQLMRACFATPRKPPPIILVTRVPSKKERRGISKIEE